MIKVKSKENEKNETGVKTKAKHPILKGIKKSVKGVVVVSLIAISVVVAYFVGDHFVSQKKAQDVVELPLQEGSEQNPAYKDDQEANDLESGIISGDVGSGSDSTSESNDQQISEEEKDLAENDPNKDHDTSNPFGR